jgi:hypothetical protein
MHYNASKRGDGRGADYYKVERKEGIDNMSKMKLFYLYQEL